MLQRIYLAFSEIFQNFYWQFLIYEKEKIGSTATVFSKLHDIWKFEHSAWINNNKTSRGKYFPLLYFPSKMETK